MITSKIELRKNWLQAKELYEKLTMVIEAEKHYMALLEYDKSTIKNDTKQLYPIVDDSIADTREEFAEVFNRLIKEYVEEEDG